MVENNLIHIGTGDTCLQCEHFHWWDGDYCCLEKMEILFSSKDGKIDEVNLKAPLFACDKFIDRVNGKELYGTVLC